MIFSGYQHQTKATASSVTSSLHLFSSLRLGPGWKFGLHFRARQELSHYRVAFAILFFWSGCPCFFFFFFCLSPMRLTIRGTCSNAQQPGKKGPGQKFWISNSSSLFGFSRRHEKALLDDTPIRDVVCFDHFNNTTFWNLDISFLFFSCTISRPWMTDTTTTLRAWNHDRFTNDDLRTRLEAGAHAFIRNETARKTLPVWVADYSTPTT